MAKKSKKPSAATIEELLAEASRKYLARVQTLHDYEREVARTGTVKVNPAMIESFEEDIKMAEQVIDILRKQIDG